MERNKVGRESDYFYYADEAHGQSQNTIILGNQVADAIYNHTSRFYGGQSLVYDNDFTGYNGDGNASSDNLLRVNDGDYTYWANNTLHGGAIVIASRHPESGEVVGHVVVERNIMLRHPDFVESKEPRVHVEPTVDGLMFRNNIIHFYDFPGMKIDADTGTQFATTFRVNGIYVLNNTFINDGPSNAAIQIQSADTSQAITLKNNLYIYQGTEPQDPRSSTSGVFVENADTTTSNPNAPVKVIAESSGNVWWQFNYSSGSNYVWSGTSEVTDGYRTKEEWNFLNATSSGGPLFNDDFLNIAVDPDTFAPTTSVNTGAAAGVVYDFYGNRRPAGTVTAGAVELNPTDSLIHTNIGIPTPSSISDPMATIDDRALGGFRVDDAATSGDHEVQTGGTGISGTSDSFHFDYQKLTGDFDLRVNVAQLDKGASYSITGLMARASLSRDGAFGYAGAEDFKYDWRTRATDGASTSDANFNTTMSFPNVWVRLQRSGSTLTGYRSTDGTNWTAIGSQTFSGLAPTLYVGLATTTASAGTQPTNALYRQYGNVGNQMPPAAPNNLYHPDSATTSIPLRWTDNSNDESGFKVEKSTDGVNFTEVYRGTTPNQESYTVTGLSANTVYYFRVRSYINGDVNSDYSNVLQGTTGPVAPTNLTASGTATAITLNWTDNSNNESGFKVERSTDGANFVELIRGTTPNQTSYTDSTVTTGTTYYYRIRTYISGIANSDYTKIASATAADSSFTAQDVGGPLPAGTFTPVGSSGTDFDMSGGGADIGGASDQFNYAYEQITGDFDWAIRVDSQTNTSLTAKAGLMLRATLDPASRHASSVVTPTGYKFVFRDLNSNVTTTGTVVYPSWARLQRQGQTLTGYYSTDGINWVSVHSYTFPVSDPFPTTAYIGMAVTSHNQGTASNVQFRSLNTNVV